MNHFSILRYAADPPFFHLGTFCLTDPSINRYVFGVPWLCDNPIGDRWACAPVDLHLHTTGTTTTVPTTGTTGSTGSRYGRFASAIVPYQVPNTSCALDPVIIMQSDCEYILTVNTYLVHTWYTVGKSGLLD